MSCGRAISKEHRDASFRLRCGGSARIAASASAEAEKETKVGLDKVPKAVLDAVRAEYEGAEIKAAETYEDDGETLYEVELTQAGKSIDVSLDEEGEIYEIEEEIDVKDLPKAVTAAVMAKYPGAKIKEAEQVTEYEDDEEDSEAKEDDKSSGKPADGDKRGDDEADDDDEEGEVSYEVEITTKDGKMLEVEVSEDGKEIEAEADDDGDEKEEKDADGKK